MGDFTKTFGSTLIPGTPDIPEVPGEPGISPVFMRLYATPSPKNTAYRYRGPSVYKTTAQIVSEYGGAVPEGSQAVYVDGLLEGYDVPGPIVMEKPSQFAGWSQLNLAAPGDWYGPIPNMEFVIFPGVPTIGNGYPEPGHNGPIVGTIQLPTTGGLVTLSRNYKRAGAGQVWVPLGYTNPAYTVTGGSAGVMMLSGFPGAAPTPGVPRIPGIPDRTVDTPVLGWQAGADSVIERANDARLSFTFKLVSGIVAGFATVRDQLLAGFDPITHAFYLDTSPTTGKARVRIMEGGRIVHTHVGDVVGDEVCAIERVGGKVAYRFDGAEIYRSRTLSVGTIIARSFLYRSGDSIGGEYA